jgi:hypothetical protein
MWRTTKRDNSTATPVSQPTWFTNHIQKDVVLKEDTSVLNPTFRLKMGGHDGQNYLWAFGRYYWITNIVSLANEYWEIQCRIDPLGSYRGHIRNTQAFVLYDSTANSEIPDRRLGIKTTASYAHTNAEMPWDFGHTSRFIAITGDAENEAGADATGVYKVTAEGIEDLGYEFDEDLEDLKNQAAQQSGFNDVITDIGTAYQAAQTASSTASTWDKFGVWFDFIGYVIGLLPSMLMITFLYLVFFVWDWLKALFVGGKALDNVKSAWWLPFGDIEGTSVSQLALGGWVEPITGGAQKITNPIKTQIVSISIPWQFSDWRNVACTEVQLYIPCIGNVTIPSSAVKGHNQLNLWFCLNVYSGQLSCRIQVGGEITVGCYGANVSSPILIGNTNINAAQVTNTIAAIGTMAAGVATGGAALAVGGAVAGIASGFESLVPVNTAVGGVGGGTSAGLGTMIWCSVITHNTSDNPANLLNIIGTPTNRLKTLTGSGFCQCLQAHMNMNAVVNESYPTEEEVQQVNNALNSGVFLE